MSLSTQDGQKLVDLLTADLTLAQAIAANPGFTELVVNLLAKAATLDGIVLADAKTLNQWVM